MGFLQSNIDERIRLAKDYMADNSPAWQTRPALIRRVDQISSIVPTVYKGEPLPAQMPFSTVPGGAVTPDVETIKLGSAAVEVRGSFAPTVTDAGFTYIAGTDNVTIYYDGTNGSKRIKQRRRNGYNETLPAGFLHVANLNPSAEGALVGPSYDLIPFYIPGSCAIGWVGPGDSGTPTFCFSHDYRPVTLDDINKASIRGREPIAASVITITLQPRPAPVPPPSTPPPPDPGTQSGNTTTNGSVTCVVDYPGQNAAENLSFNGSAHASDNAGHNITGWEVYLDGVRIYNYAGVAKPSITWPINTSSGSHSMTVKAYNSAGTHADVTVPFTTSDLSGGGSGTGGNPTPPPPTNPTPSPIPSCVMLGTVIEPLGPSPWHQQQIAQNEWVRIFTDRGRELIATPEHPVYTSRAGRTEMRDVRKGDKVVCIEGEEQVLDVKAFNRPGVKVSVHMDWGHLYWANGVLSHNIKLNLE